MAPRRMMLVVLAALLSGAVLPAAADEGPRVYRHHDRYRLSLPPERHVVEKVQPPWSGNFIINGRRFTGRDSGMFQLGGGRAHQADRGRLERPLRRGGVLQCLAPLDLRHRLRRPRLALVVSLWSLQSIPKSCRFFDKIMRPKYRADQQA